MTQCMDMNTNSETSLEMDLYALKLYNLIIILSINFVPQQQVHVRHEHFPKIIVYIICHYLQKEIRNFL